jgi:predicted SAM-dependent methyltransferase
VTLPSLVPNSLPNLSHKFIAAIQRSRYHDAMTNLIKLDLGAGRVKRNGYISVDRQLTGNVDLVCDVESKLPFRDNSVDEVFSRHLFEHVTHLIQLFEEVHRICKPGARVIINVPYYTSVKAYKDPTHVNFFTEKTFEYFEGKNWDNFEFPFKGAFRIHKVDYLYQRPFHKYFPFISFWRRILWNTVTSMITELEVIK